MAITTVKVRISGLKEANEALQKLGIKVARKIGRKAARIGAEPMLHAARSKAPRETGLLVESLYIRTGMKGDQIRAKVTSNPKVSGVGPDGRKRRPATYAQLVELGHRTGAGKGQRLLKVKGMFEARQRNARLVARAKQGDFEIVHSKGFVPPQPYLRPAFDSQGGASVNRMLDVLKAEITKAINESPEARTKRLSRAVKKAGG